MRKRANIKKREIDNYIKKKSGEIYWIHDELLQIYSMIYAAPWIPKESRIFLLSELIPYKLAQLELRMGDIPDDTELSEVVMDRIRENGVKIVENGVNND